MSIPYWFSAADLAKCHQIPDWGHFLLSAVPSDYPASKLPGLVRESKESVRDRLKVLAAASLAGSAWGPFGTLLGGLVGMTYALEDRPKEIGWRQQSKISKLEESWVQDWVNRPGPPWTETLPGGVWVDRRYQTSAFLPAYECERNAQGEPLRIAFRFGSAYFEHRFGSGIVEVHGPEGRQVDFAGRLDDSSGLGVRIELADAAALFFGLDGQAFFLPAEPEIWEIPEGWTFPVAKVPLVDDSTKFDCPFPVGWLGG